MHTSEWEAGINWGSESDADILEPGQDTAIQQQQHTTGGLVAGFGSRPPPLHAHLSVQGEGGAFAHSGGAASNLSSRDKHLSLVDADKVKLLPSGMYQISHPTFRPSADTLT